MKVFAIFGVFLLVAFHQVNANYFNLPESVSFSEIVSNLTDASFSAENEPNDLVRVAYKTRAIIQASQMFEIDFQIYRNIYNTLHNLAYLASDLPQSNDLLNTISRIQNNFDGYFDELNAQRDVDASELPSTINKLIDEFVGRYTETVIELFDNIYTQSKNLEAEALKLAADSITLMDKLVEKIEQCLEIPRTEFKNTFQCREETRSSLPGLAHNNAMIEAITRDMFQFESLKVDGKTSVFELEQQLANEKYLLMQQIEEERLNRENAKEAAKEQSENEN